MDLGLAGLLFDVRCSLGKGTCAEKEQQRTLL